MVRNREEAARAAEARTTNPVGMCQNITWNYFDAAPAGDFDGDGRADAEDGWKIEPASAKHVGDRKPPRGTPVSYLGGSNDDGHRAISLGPINGVWMIRSTDAPRAGVTSTVPLDWPEKQWGLTYAGWSETINGQRIPMPPVTAPVPDPVPVPPRKKRSRGKWVDKSLAKMKKATGTGVRGQQIKDALAAIKKIGKTS